MDFQLLLQMNPPNLIWLSLKSASCFIRVLGGFLTFNCSSLLPQLCCVLWEVGEHALEPWQLREGFLQNREGKSSFSLLSLPLQARAVRKAPFLFNDLFPVMHVPRQAQPAA